MDGLLQAVRALAGRRVLVAGDVMLDRYQWGKVERVSPEAPIPVMVLEEEEEHPGGAGCVMTDVAALGAAPAALTVVGEDEVGARLVSVLEEAGVDVSGVVRAPRRRTSVKTRMMGYVQSAHRATQHIMRLDEERVAPIDKASEEELCDRAAALVGGVDAVLISDYDKGVVTPRLCRCLIDAARREGRMVVVDPRRAGDYGLYHGATVVTPNRWEAERATGVRTDTFDGVRKAGAALVEALDLNFCVVTVDKDGLYLVRSDGSGTHFPTRARSVYDVSGAGDMVLATLGTALAAGSPVEAALELANVAAGIEVTKFGALPVSREELEAELARRAPSAADKVLPLARVSDVMRRLRAAGRTIVFTNGCFDILHAGHVRLLEFAKEQGDVLIVGLNSDESVRRIKDRSRPVNEQADRALLLAALETVDFVVTFDEETPADIITKVRPDVLVKGEDWRDRGVVGREFVESYGGRVVLAPILENRSTSLLIEKVKKLGT